MFSIPCCPFSPTVTPNVARGEGVSALCLFVWASVFSEGFSLSMVLDKPDCNKLTKEPSESMHSDNIALRTCMKSFWKLNSKISGFCSNIQAFPGVYLEFSKLSTARSVCTSHKDQLSSWAPCCLARGTKGICMPRGIPHPSLRRSVKTSRESSKRSTLMRHSPHVETEG